MRFGTIGRTLTLAALLATPSLAAQDSNIWLPVDRIEDLMANQDFEVGQARDTRFEGDRTQLVTMRFADGTSILAKWAPAPFGGGEFNNRPAYEMAAYEFQKLFLDPEDYVVPPVVMRAFPLSEYKQYDDRVQPTFRDVNSVVAVLQYWLASVTDEDFHDEDRFEADSVYARHFADFNLFTHLARHNDENAGNYLISTDPQNPRVFSVDNGVAFGREESDVGYRYRNLQIDRFPRATVERLRQITEEDLRQGLAVLAQFESRDGQLVRVEPTENLDEGRQVRTEDGVYQFGLTDREIGWIYDRLENFLEKVDKGDYELF